jgi:hypothetical protein
MINARSLSFRGSRIVGGENAAPTFPFLGFVWVAVLLHLLMKAEPLRFWSLFQFFERFSFISCDGLAPVFLGLVPIFRTVLLHLCESFSPCVLGSCSDFCNIFGASEQLKQGEPLAALRVAHITCRISS